MIAEKQLDGVPMLTLKDRDRKYASQLTQKHQDIFLANKHHRILWIQINNRHTETIITKTIQKLYFILQV